MSNDLGHGTFVISLDFELLWGMKDMATPEGYGYSNIAQVPEVIDRLIALFEKYEVKATFATVGLIFAKDSNQALDYSPENLPNYQNPTLSPYADCYLQNIATGHKHLYFAPEKIAKLKASRNIEIGTHTFCHYYCNEPGQTIEQFEQDIKSAVEIAKLQGIELKSIVFPRNEVNPQYLEVCQKYGITSYRGNALRFFSATSKTGALRNRICRLADTYLPINSSTTYAYSSLKEKGIINIRASRFLSPYRASLSFLEGLRLLRICKEISQAAKRGELYHLWWHPHNFGANTDTNFAFLEKILQHYSHCHSEFGMQSLTMNELATLISQL